MAKEIINKMKRQPIQRKKILANHVFDKGLMSRYEKNFVNSIAKKKKSNLKMDRGSEQTFFQRRHKDGQQVHEKVLNITNLRNANQNHNEISLHTCYQNDNK